MKYNMNEWLAAYRDGSCRKPLPILSFPGTQLIGKTVEEVVKDGHLQALCMEAIARRFDTGAVFGLMDLSLEAEAFGAEVIYFEDDIPTVHGTLLQDEDDVEALTVPKVGSGRTGEYIKGIQEICGIVSDRPVLAGIIGPYSLAGRLLDMSEIMILCFEEPEMVEQVLKKVTEFLISYAKALKEAGANGVVMAEPAAGILAPDLLQEFSNPYVEKVREAVEDEDFLFVYHNCGPVEPLYEELSELQVSTYSLGNAIDLESMIQKLPKESMIMGNIDPTGILRNGTSELIRQETKVLLEKCSKYPNFILSSGCDIPPQTPIENLDAFFEAAKEFYNA